jgi:hypothetical protein
VRADAWLAAQLDRLSPRGGSPISLDVSYRTDLNRVQLGVAGQQLTPAERALIARTKVRYGGLVQVVAQPAGTATATSLATGCTDKLSVGNYCYAPLRAGLEIFNVNSQGQPQPGYCTGGFIASSRTNGVLYEFTAGHCAAEDHTDSWATYFPDASVHKIGTVHSYVFGGGDEAILNINNPSGWQLPQGWVYVLAGPGTGVGGLNEEYPISSAQYSTQGARECATGAVSGSVCGTVVSLGHSAFECTSNGICAWVNNLGEDSFCETNGDSGGPVFASHQAFGLASAQGTDPLHGYLCVTYFQGIIGAENALNVNIVLAHNLSGIWHNAGEIPGSGTLNVGGDADITSVSCASAGNCSAGGYYQDGSGNVQASVASEANGTWGNTVEVPGTAALNAGAYAQIASVSCASPGNCTAGGYYLDGSYNQQAFVVSQVNGNWGNAMEVPGTSALNAGGYAQITSVSCASGGNCSAGGYYYDGSNNIQAFVTSEVNGIWGNATEVPGTAAVNVYGAWVTSVSCTSVGYCSAGGFYTDGSGLVHAIVVSQAHGKWGNAIQIPASGALGDGGAVVNSLSCGSAGNCSAGGYFNNGGLDQAFVASEAGGTWGNAVEVPGTAALNAGGQAELTSLSCPSAGFCSAGGYYLDGSGQQQAFVASEAGGTWANAVEVPGEAALNAGGYAQITSISCASEGNCSAGGAYVDGSDHQQAFVASQVNGTWGNAVQVPGTAALNNGGNAAISAVSCTSAGNSCSAGGYYTNSGTQTFAVDEASGT